MTLDLYKHWEKIQQRIGCDLSYIEIVKTLDDMGAVIGIDETQITIRGIITPASTKTDMTPIGTCQAGDLIMYILSDVDVIESDQTTPYSTTGGYIDFDSIRYKILKIDTAFDCGIVAIVKYRCQKTEG